jgi:hypothetical protein
VCIPIFHVFQCFSPYITWYSMCLSFSMIFSVLTTLQFLEVCISNFSRFLVFLVIFHVLPCVFLISHDFPLSRHTPGPTECISHFSRFWVFLAIF